jgi:fumarylacetoacetase
VNHTDATHDPTLRTWVESANQPDSDFPIQNLPLGAFVRGSDAPRLGMAIGDQILDLWACAKAGYLAPELREACAQPVLNDLMAMDSEARVLLRRTAIDLLRAGAKARRELLAPAAEVRMLVPADIRDYTDFYASVYHATNVGTMLRPDNPLLPNYKHIPIGYHGRSSSIVVSGTPVRRPYGQVRPDAAAPPEFRPTRLLDYELEVGLFIGPGNELGAPVPIAEAGAQVVGLCLVNDWSARDVQAWEYQPLGPFLAKSFATTVSPWVVTAEALAPFRARAFSRPPGDPAPLPYLLDDDDQQSGSFDLRVEAWLASAAMRSAGAPHVRLSRASFTDMYWTPAQMVAHHSSNGCNLRAGDLLASGTVSGPDEDQRGCLLELTRRGAEPLLLPSGEERKFLEDGDEVILRGYCQREGFVRIGFGECRGIVVPA